MKRKLYHLALCILGCMLAVQAGAQSSVSVDDNFTIGIYHRWECPAPWNNAKYFRGFRSDHSYYDGTDGKHLLDSTFFGSTKGVNSTFPLLREAGFNTVLLYTPDYRLSHNLIDGAKGYSEHAKNCDLKVIFDFKVAFQPDSLYTSPDGNYYGHTKGDFIMSFPVNDNLTRPNLKYLYDSVFSDPFYGDGFAGFQLSEEASTTHTFTASYMGEDCGQGGTLDSCVHVSVPPYAISNAIDTLNDYFSNGGVYFPTIVAGAQHGGVIDSFTYVDKFPSWNPTLNHGPWHEQNYIMSDSMSTLPSTFIDASYYVFENIHSESNANIDSLHSKRDEYQRRHYLGRFKTIDFAKERIDEVIAGISTITWQMPEGVTRYSFFPGVTDRSNSTVYKNTARYWGADTVIDGESVIEASQRFALHTDTSSGAANANALWFQAYTSIIHGADGVIFWEWDCWEPNARDSARARNMVYGAPFAERYSDTTVPIIYQDYLAPLTRELRWLSDKSLIGKSSKVVYKKTDHADNNCIVPAVNSYVTDSEIDARRKQVEDYGVRYTINTNGDDVVMILSNCLPNSISCPLDFSSIGNQIIQNSDTIEYLFHEDIDPTTPGYKTDRRDGVDLGNGTVLRSRKVPFNNDTLTVEFGPLDVVVLRFQADNDNLNTQFNHWEKEWTNDGDGWIGGSKLQVNDTLFIGDFMGNGTEQILVMQTGANDAWTSLHSYNETTEEWDWEWSNDGDTSEPIMDFRGIGTYAVGKFEGGKDMLLGYEPGGNKTLYEYQPDSFKWKSRWSALPTDQIFLYKKILAVGDFDADGTEELIGYDNPGWTTEFKFDGTEFVWGTWTDQNMGKVKNYRNRLMQCADFNGDGKDELMGFGDDVTLFEFDPIAFEWDSIWADSFSIGGVGYPFVVGEAVLSGDIDQYDGKDEIFVLQTGPQAGWATSLDLIYNGGTNSYDWDWNYSANGSSSIEYIRDWPVPEITGSNTEYYLIQVNATKPKYLFAKRRFQCNGLEPKHLLSLYKTQAAYNYKYLSDIKVLNQDKENNVLVYPNPFSGSLNIATLKGEEIKQVSVYDSQGKLLFTTLSKTGAKLNVDFASDPSISPGLYMIRVETDKGNYARQVVYTK
ncbi:MAG: T9SS type A sorting domain-containing protein [Bacteroidia bacterium]|nr:T9SS type A sorting domain-containing protein [Bacteroidia bacterium]